MQPLPSLIHDLHPPTSTFSSDTIFEQSLTSIFGDARNQHGEPGEFVLYTPSDSTYLHNTNSGVAIEDIKNELGVGGEDAELEELEEYVQEVLKGGRGVKLRLADAVRGETGLFASFVWNAAILAAEMLNGTAPPTLPRIDVQGKTILELGAGTALPSLVSTLLGAKAATVTDYPSEALIGNIRQNVEMNIPETLRGKVEVWGHCWGILEEQGQAEVEEGIRAPTEWVTVKKGAYDVVLAADCMWMGDQHTNLAKSIHHFLSPAGKVLAIAGFHTGRQKVADFFRVCKEEGLVLESIVEVDVEGGTREWEESRGWEDPVERKRWLTVGVLGK
ncbi:hypothetical protein BJ508DRAFT_240194 [Ascobolus immersus RN42]|uniref:Nicotinamide N-methyltransferase n=1 Tax=Ascobolus immersus RN42 TaxID=1160509 RepID=A0A3N4I1Y2_ASCIM|nr:hypothetical protein BJ508DRAFT_240194 [Ascobolus immersus RN42]